ncbi:MAG TPA: alanine racemase [Candidatus Limnocylindrales bacterium]|nr:alanine racemase [Candidatus Limnocylindrales bacterium]
MSYRSIINARLRALEKNFTTYNNIYISRSAVLHNFDMFTELSPGGHVIPVLKANAYGHGLEQIANILKERSLPYLAVDGYFEALRIYEVSKQPVLVMGAIHPNNFTKMNWKSCAFVVYDEQTLEALAATGTTVRIHVEIDTGMSRHGVRPSDLSSFLELLKSHPKIEVEGIMTHLADADNPLSTEHMTEQVAKFDAAVDKIRSEGFSPKYVHIAQSAGSAKVHSKTANTLRVGIALYGITPLASDDRFAVKLAQLQPALTLTSTVAKVIEIGAGDAVGYGCTFVAKRPSRIGVLPLGYYEGLPRQLSNVGTVKHKDKYLPITGRVCMNHTMVDITDTDVSLGDVVTVISSNKADENSIDQIARRYDIFNYGLLVGLNQTVRRSVVE